jgi:transposase
MKKNISLFPETTIGIDLGDRYSHGCRLDGHGEVVERFRFETTRTGLAKTFEVRVPCRVVLEVGTHSPWISRSLEALGYEVIVANAREVQSISKSDRKNDASDAEQLARLGRADPKLLHPITHRQEDTQRDRALLAVRDKLVRTRGSLVVQARGIAKGLGERLPKCTTAAMPKRVREASLEGFFPGLSSLLEMIETLSAKIRECDREIEHLSKERYPETALLRQVGGVGSITSLAYVLTIEDPNRFSRSRSVGAYLGMRPRQRDSGQRSPKLSISKAGDQYLRSLLVECAQYIMTLGPDCDLRRFGKRILASGGPGAYQRSIVAVARKLAVLLHSLWSTAEVYDPFRQARVTQAAA